MMKLTIFTATYNRAHLLPRLYESIKSQDITDVEWLIVDDGSTDNTEQEVGKYAEEGLVDIKYIKKENGGKHTAFNVGLEKARGEWFFSVDSDDKLPDDSIAKCKSVIADATEDIMGIVSLKSGFDGKILGNRYPQNKFISSFRKLESDGMQGERSIILRTVIKKFAIFPIIKGEKFMGESVLYDLIFDKNLIVTNDVLTNCEYQEDGLSSNPYRIMVNNPGGYKLYYSRRIDMAQNYRQLFGYIVRYLAFRRMYRGEEAPDYNGKYELLCKMLTPFSALFANQYLRHI